MPPLRSNPNVIVPADVNESVDLYARCEDGELDGFQLYVFSDVASDGGVGIPAYIPCDSDPSQITPALIQEGITQGPLHGWALPPTKQRHPSGYGSDVGSKPEDIRSAFIEAGRLAPNRRAQVADAIRKILGKPIKYDRWRDKTAGEIEANLSSPTPLRLWQDRMRNEVE